MATRLPMGADQSVIDSPPALPTPLMLANLRVRLERQARLGDPNPSLQLLFAVACVLLGALVVFAG